MFLSLFSLRIQDEVLMNFHGKIFRDRRVLRSIKSEAIGQILLKPPKHSSTATKQLTKRTPHHFHLYPIPAFRDIFPQTPGQEHYDREIFALTYSLYGTRPCERFPGIIEWGTRCRVTDALAFNWSINYILGGRRWKTIWDLHQGAATLVGHEGTQLLFFFPGLV